MKPKLLLFCVLSLILSSKINAQYGLQEAFVSLPNFQSPIDITSSEDGTNRLFVVEQNGIIYVIQNTSSVSVRKIFLDISDRVTQTGGEAGLLGLAFHPNYESNGYFYVNYTSGTDPIVSHVTRFQVSAANPDSAVKFSELNLITLPQPYTNHNGGCLKFGPDGYLYIAFGDGGWGGDPHNFAQNTSVLLGKILRIDVNSVSGGNNYSIPPTNYFADSTGSQKKEIYAWGLRNPWKFSFDPVSGRLWCGDVGQDYREEVSIIENGKNYGWNKMEGFLCYPDTLSCDTAGRRFMLPVVDYPRSQGQVITGGFVYRGNEIPLLRGKYVYCDFGSKNFWAVTYNGSGNVINEYLFLAPTFISSFGVDDQNVLYCLGYYNGRIYKVTGPPTSVTYTNSEVPNIFELKQNFPNPFNPSTKINFSIPVSGNVSLQVYDMSGKVVAELMNNEYVQAGNYAREFNAASLSSSVYIYKLTAGNFTASKRMVLVK